MQGIVESHAFIKAQLTYSLGLTKATYSKEADGKYYLSLAGKAVISCANKDSALDSTYTIRIDEIDTSFSIKNDGTWVYEESPISSWAEGKENASSLKLSLIDKNGNTMCEQTIPLTKSGTNPIVIEVSPEVILHKKSSTKKNYVLTVRVHDGENLISNENFSVAYSYPTDVSRAAQQIYDLRGATKRTETITVAANAEPDGGIGIAVTYKGNTYTKSVQISTIADGDQGYQGPVYYCAGVWSADKEYTRTRDLCPYVIYNDGSGLTDDNTQCYMLNTIVENYKSSTTPPNDSDHWTHVEKQELILAHMAVMDYASIGDAMFKGSYMFSKAGVTMTKGNTYLNFDENDPENTNKFVPNFYVNFKTGKGSFSGTVKADNFYHKVYVWGIEKGAYYYLNGKYYSLEEVNDNDIDIDKATLCAGPADVIVVPANANTSYYRTVRLPRAADYEGKIIEVIDTNVDSNTELTVTAVGNPQFSLGIYIDTGSTETKFTPTSSAPSSLNVGIGKRSRFYSIEMEPTQTGGDRFYWLLLDE